MNTDKIYAQALASEYAAKEERKVVALRKLDKRAKLPATVFTYTFGIIAALIFGVGMCLCMHVIGPGTPVMTGIGVVLGVLGMVAAGANYPLYKKLLERGKKKYASDILRLAKEISED